MKNDARIAPMIGSVQANMQYYFATTGSTVLISGAGPVGLVASDLILAFDPLDLQRRGVRLDPRSG